MYHSIQEPMYKAVSKPTSIPRKVPKQKENPQAESPSPNNSPLPNPWSSQSSPQNGFNPLRSHGSSPLQLSSLFSRSPSGFSQSSPFAPRPQQMQQQRLPEQRFAGQIAELEEMGFGDRPAVVRALVQTDGSVEDAITILFPDPNESESS